MHAFGYSASINYLITQAYNYWLKITSQLFVVVVCFSAVSLQKIVLNFKWISYMLQPMSQTINLYTEKNRSFIHTQQNASNIIRLDMKFQIKYKSIQIDFVYK